MLKLPLLLSLLFIIACAPLFAEDSSPTDVEIVGSVEITVGLDRPTDRANPGPYLNIAWDYGPDAVWVEIFDERGRTRNANYGGAVWPWLHPVASGGTFGDDPEDLADAGCGATKTGIKLTRDCLNRFRQSHGNEYLRYPRNFIDDGTRYEIRVRIYVDEVGGETPVRHVRIPNPQPTKPTPRPSCPTPTPCPTQQPCPTPQSCPVCPVCPIPDPEPTPAPTTEPNTPEFTSIDALMSAHQEIQAIGRWRNDTKTWQSYFRDSGNNTLWVLETGKPYTFIVTEAVTVRGHKLTCVDQNCINRVVW